MVETLVETKWAQEAVTAIEVAVDDVNRSYRCLHRKGMVRHPSSHASRWSSVWNRERCLPITC